MRVEDGVEIREPGDKVRQAVTGFSREISPEFPENRILEMANMLLGWAASYDVRPVEFASERITQIIDGEVVDLIAIGLKGVQAVERSIEEER